MRRPPRSRAPAAKIRCRIVRPGTTVPSSPEAVRGLSESPSGYPLKAPRRLRAAGRRSRKKNARGGRPSSLLPSRPTVPVDGPPTPSLPWANLGINLLLILVGIAVAVVIGLLARRVVRRSSWLYWPHTLVILDTVFVAITAVITAALDLWRLHVLLNVSLYPAAGYAVWGIFFGLLITAKYLGMVAKDQSETKIKQLTAQAELAEAARDAALAVEALAEEVMRPKILRLAERRRTGVGSLEDAWNPRKQIHMIAQVLHGHIRKRLEPGHRLRIGIYVPDAKGTTLEAIYSWDGENTEVFSNRHKEYMRLNNPGGGRSVVVECWLATDPFQFVAHCAKHPNFRYFDRSQETTLKSMVAFRHNLSSPEEAFIITLDSDQAGFFASDVESECRLLLPAFSRRIELELLAASVTPPPSLSGSSPSVLT